MKNNIIAKIILLVLIINIFNYSWNIFLKDNNIILANTLKTVFLWPLNQFPENNFNIPVKNNQYLTNVNLIVPEKEEVAKIYESKVDFEQRIINAVKTTDQSVVSIIAMKDSPVNVRYQADPLDLFNDDFFNPFNFYFKAPEQQIIPEQKYEKKEVASGSGFVISADGYIVTNKHVISEKNAEYIVFLNDGTKHSAKIVAVDPLEDFGLIKIEKQNLIPLKLGNSDSLQLGQSVIAIGNALGEFKNTISVGVISGLNRSIVASGNNLQAERLNNLIQTDAAINRGNSGGPLLNLNGEVIGINTATVISAQNIGFAIPINKIKNIINQAIVTGKITVPYIGVYYIQLDQSEAERRKLNVQHGALLTNDKSESAIIKNSPAEKAGLLDNDIILSINKEKITFENPLPSIVRKYSPGENVNLEVKRNDEIINISLILGEK